MASERAIEVRAALEEIAKVTRREAEDIYGLKVEWPIAVMEAFEHRIGGERVGRGEMELDTLLHAVATVLGVSPGEGLTIPVLAARLSPVVLSGEDAQVLLDAVAGGTPDGVKLYNAKKKLTQIKEES